MCLKRLHEEIQLTSLKSWTVRVKPIDSIKKPSAMVKRSLVNQATAGGFVMPTATPMHT